ncbi:RHS repeat domain-containing protein [Flavobacterium luteolum]|uniref:RHS repeat domain-containing protein n=1 Tax=Flavobacterium luteolum TaxID=3003259 RepID=UPI00248D5EC7|nr:RHS repeat-associated core domain-containing protein [Flavobacterium luteolum]
MGSASYITTKSGSISQHVEYIAFGEVLFEEHSSSFSSPYLFNGKELDRETNLSYYGARYYDAKTNLWLSVDKMAEKMPNFGTFVFSFNNPIKFVDPDGNTPYPITIRSFAPFKHFGGGFHGDDRSFSTNLNASARVHQKINFDTDKENISLRTWSSNTYHTAAPSIKATASPSGTFTSGFGVYKEGSDKNFTFSTSYSGANPLTPGAPNIDVSASFYINENKEKGFLSIRGNLKGDNFPSTEAFITDPSGQSVFIGVGYYEGSPFSSLWGKNERPISEFSFNIMIDKKGNFTGVQSTDGSNKVYSLKEWNALFEKADPHKNEKNE